MIPFYSGCPAGHSLGGALAMLAAFDLAPVFPWGSVEVHTIGAPRPGNAAFAKVRCMLCPGAAARTAMAACSQCIETGLSLPVPHVLPV